jgi:hypothetical protein
MQIQSLNLLEIVKLNVNKIFKIYNIEMISVDRIRIIILIDNKGITIMIETKIMKKIIISNQICNNKSQIE